MFLLDAVLALLIWPLLIMLALPARLSLLQPSVGTVATALVFPAASLLFFYALGLYRRDVILHPRRALARLPLGVAMAALILVALGKLAHRVMPDWPEAADGTFLFTAAMLGFCASGLIARMSFRGLRWLPSMRPRLLVVGAGARAWDLAWMLRHEGRNLHYDITFLHDPSYGPLDARLLKDSSVVVLTAHGGVLAEARRLGASDIVVAPDERRGMDLQPLMDCKSDGFVIEQYLSFVEREIRRLDLKRMENHWLLYSDGFQISALDRFLKRGLDVLVSLLILAVAAPFLLVAMLAIVLDDGLPIFYRQTRVTLGGREFQILKLRTMRRNAETSGAVWAADRDPRITRVGNFLRRSRLDELPQLFNVLRGEMSLVGPRPERPAFVAQLTAQLPLYQQRHLLKAGITGWAQVNYPYGASVDDARSKLSYDLYYVKNYAIWFDLIVLLQTLRVVLWPGGVR